jgi:hypothetical protein
MYQLRVIKIVGSSFLQYVIYKKTVGLYVNLCAVPCLRVATL